eukprot:746962-Hanusia_phi.AAC.15
MFCEGALDMNHGIPTSYAKESENLGGRVWNIAPFVRRRGIIQLRIKQIRIQLRTISNPSDQLKDTRNFFPVLRNFNPGFV